MLRNAPDGVQREISSDMPVRSSPVPEDARFPVESGSLADKKGLDGWLEQTNALSKGWLKQLDPQSRLQIVEALRETITSTNNGAYAEQITGARGRIIAGADGLDLQINSGDILDSRVTNSVGFKKDLARVIASNYSHLAASMGGPDGIASTLKI
jgi:hypothetical protein